MQYKNTKKHLRGQVIRLPNGKIGGKLYDNVLRKECYASRHFLYSPSAICFDVDTLMRARDLGATTAEVTDKESGRVYRAALSRFWHKGFSVDHSDYRSQLGLVLGEWDHGEPTTSLAATTQAQLEASHSVNQPPVKSVGASTRRNLLIGLVLLLSIAIAEFVRTLLVGWGVLPNQSAQILSDMGLALLRAAAFLGSLNNILSLVEKLFGRK